MQMIDTTINLLARFDPPRETYLLEKKNRGDRGRDKFLCKEKIKILIAIL